VRSRGGRLSCTRFGVEQVLVFFYRSVGPMSAVYPLHLQREIDRRWLQRLEETTPIRARLKVMIDVLREALDKRTLAFRARKIPGFQPGR
jgi:hypothetical protein